MDCEFVIGDVHKIRFRFILRKQQSQGDFSFCDFEGMTVDVKICV